MNSFLCLSNVLGYIIKFQLEHSCGKSLNPHCEPLSGIFLQYFINGRLGYSMEEHLRNHIKENMGVTMATILHLQERIH